MLNWILHFITLTLNVVLSNSCVHLPTFISLINCAGISQMTIQFFILMINYRFSFVFYRKKLNMVSILRLEYQYI